jgi:hypothetical protein
MLFFLPDLAVRPVNEEVVAPLRDTVGVVEYSEIGGGVRGGRRRSCAAFSGVTVAVVSAKVNRFTHMIP